MQASRQKQTEHSAMTPLARPVSVCDRLESTQGRRSPPHATPVAMTHGWAWRPSERFARKPRRRARGERPAQRGQVRVRADAPWRCRSSKRPPPRRSAASPPPVRRHRPCLRARRHAVARPSARARAATPSRHLPFFGFWAGRPVRPQHVARARHAPARARAPPARAGLRDRTKPSRSASQVGHAHQKARGLIAVWPRMACRKCGATDGSDERASSRQEEMRLTQGLKGAVVGGFK